MKLFRKKSAADMPRRRQTADEPRERDAQQNSTFRRNRTLTGSLSSSVSSTTETRGDLQSSRTQAHHLARQRRKLGGVLLGILAIATVLALLLFDLTVRPIVSSSDHAISLDAVRYENAIKDYLERHPIERLRIALGEGQLTNYLRTVVPEVQTVTQGGFDGLSATDFTLTMRRPIAGWIIGGKQYFVDEQGVPFEKNYYETPEVNVVDQSGVQQTAGTAVASTRFLTFVGRTVSQAKLQGLVVKQAIIPPGTTRELEVQLDHHTYPVKLSLDRPVAEQVEDMKRAVGYFDKKGITPQYIDVRVSGRAYYK